MKNREKVNKQLREEVNQFREDNFNVSWSEIARRANISIPYMLDWKDGRIEFGEVAVGKLRGFLDKHTR